MFLNITILLAVIYLFLSIITRPYRTGKRPITFRKLVNIPSDKVEEFYEYIRDISPSFLIKIITILPDGTRVTVACSRRSKNPDKPMAKLKEEKIGGTELCPIYRIFDIDGQNYPCGECHYSVNTFAPLDDKTILITEERAANLSLRGLLVVCYYMNKFQRAQVRALHKLNKGEPLSDKEKAPPVIYANEPVLPA